MLSNLAPHHAPAKMSNQRKMPPQDSHSLRELLAIKASNAPEPIMELQPPHDAALQHSTATSSMPHTVLTANSATTGTPLQAPNSTAVEELRQGLVPRLPPLEARRTAGPQRPRPPYPPGKPKRTAGNARHGTTARTRGPEAAEPRTGSHRPECPPPSLASPHVCRPSSVGRWPLGRPFSVALPTR